MGPFIKDVGIFFSDFRYPVLFHIGRSFTPSSPSANFNTFPHNPHVTPSPFYGRSPKCYVHYGYQCRRCSRVGIVHTVATNLWWSRIPILNFSSLTIFGGKYFISSYFCNIIHKRIQQPNGMYISFMLSRACFWPYYNYQHFWLKPFVFFHYTNATSYRIRPHIIVVAKNKDRKTRLKIVFWKMMPLSWAIVKWPGHERLPKGQASNLLSVLSLCEALTPNPHTTHTRHTHRAHHLGISYYVNFLGRLCSNGFQLKWRFGTHGNWKN